MTAQVRNPTQRRNRFLPYSTTTDTLLMPSKLIVVLSGEICSGKTSLARRFEEQFSFRVVRTRQILTDLYHGNNPSRFKLQALGEKLDRETNGEWVVRYLQDIIFKKNPNHRGFIIDAVRVEPQIEALRAAFGNNVVHVFLDASSSTLLKRYLTLYGHGRQVQTVKQEYKKAKADPTEASVKNLQSTADLVINTSVTTEIDVFVRAASFIGLFSNYHTPLVDVIVGAQFGSEGKGQICAHLAPEYNALVRVGGPNAGHTVFATPSPHKFHIIPSGCVRAPEAKLIIGPGAVIDLGILEREISTYKIEVGRLVIDSNATIITAQDKKSELKLVNAIGSTGQGVGYATANNIVNRFPENKNKAHYYEKELKGFLGSASEELEKIYRGNGKILLEGTQGTGLSLYHGFYPHVTSRDTTVAGCLAEAGIAPKRVRKIVLVTRTYPIRVESPQYGSSGHFESEELSWEEISLRSGINIESLVSRERTTSTNKQRRVAEFSWFLFRRACELN